MSSTVANRVFFGILLIVVTAAFIWLIRQFLQPIFWAVALAIVFYPVHRALRNKFGAHSSLAAAISVVVILLVVVLPVMAIVGAMAGEAADIHHRITCDLAEEPDCEKIDLSAALVWADQTLPLALQAAERIGIDREDLVRLQTRLSDSAVVVGQYLAARAVSFGQGTLRIAIYFFLMLYLLFFFLRDARITWPAL